MMRTLLVAFFLLPATCFAAPKKPEAPDLRPAALTVAHTVFLTADTNNVSPAAYQSFRTTLESTHRYTLAPTPLGVDLLLIFSAGYTVLKPELTLQLRDAHTAVFLGSITTTWARLPNDKKNAEAVTHLLKSMFLLDSSGPPPAFQAALVPEISNKRRLWGGLTQSLADLGPQSTKLPTGIGPALAEAKTVLVVKDTFTDVREEFQQAPRDFATDLAANGRFRVVADLNQADLLLRMDAYEYCAQTRDHTDEQTGRDETECIRTERALRVTVNSSATLGFLFTTYVDISSDYAKSLAKFEAQFLKQYALDAAQP